MKEVDSVEMILVEGYLWLASEVILWTQKPWYDSDCEIIWAQIIADCNCKTMVLGFYHRTFMLLKPGSRIWFESGPIRT